MAVRIDGVLEIRILRPHDRIGPFFMRVNFRLLLSMRNFPTCALQNAISKDLTTTEGSEIITREIRGPNYHALQCTLYIDAPTPLCPSAS